MCTKISVEHILCNPVFHNEEKSLKVLVKNENKPW